MPPKAKAKASGVNKALLKQTSLVEPVDSSGQVYKGMQVWSCDAPLVKTNPDELYAKCVVLPGSTKTTLKLRQLEPEVNESFDSANENCHNVNTGTDALSYPDIGGLPHTNSAAVLDYMRVRFLKGNIYCTADPLLVAINPFKNVGGTTQEDIGHIANLAVEKCLPHTFTIAKTAAENLINVQKSQTIIVSGESGAGKTEATKLAMRFFAFTKGSSGDSKIQEAVMGANPVLEAFGNAKTVRNDNSSRFGRFMQLQLGNRGGIMFGIVKGFLLEKSRVVMQENQERSYHIFYQMLKGMDQKEKEKYEIKGIDYYKTINSHCLDVATIDDLQDYKEVRESLNKMKMSSDNQDSMFSILSGVMHLGNVTFRGDEKAEINDETPLKLACRLAFLDFDTIKIRLLIKQSMAGGQVIESTWSQQDALMLLSSLQRAVYDALFQWIMSVLNLIIQNPEGMQVFMGMLDIFGFEVFENNSLEQLFINITNEFLQKNFVDVVFERESALYKKEGISAGDMKWTDNNEVINVLIGKRGLMTHLEDQCLAPGGNDQKVISAAFQAVGSSGKLVKAKINQAENFIVQHTIGAISYNCVGFLIKNKDVLRAEFLEPLQTSPNAVVAALFKGVVIEKGKLDKGRLIGSQYMQQLHSMIGIINVGGGPSVSTAVNRAAFYPMRPKQRREEATHVHAIEGAHPDLRVVHSGGVADSRDWVLLSTALRRFPVPVQVCGHGCLLRQEGQSEGELPTHVGFRRVRGSVASAGGPHYGFPSPRRSEGHECVSERRTRGVGACGSRYGGTVPPVRPTAAFRSVHGTPHASSGPYSQGTRHQWDELTPFPCVVI